MRRSKTLPLGQLLKGYLKDVGIEKQLNERRLLNAWSQVLGPVVADYTKKTYIRNHILYVQVTSAALRQELMMSRESLVRHLNKEVGTEVITDIVFS